MLRSGQHQVQPGSETILAVADPLQQPRGARETKRKWASQQSAQAREIGAIPAIADIERRSACAHSLRRFCETYNPDAFTLAWSDDHLRAIARIEEAVEHGALYAFAMPRGAGKTSLCRMASLWAIAYAKVRYVFVIGANAEKAQDTLDAIKTWIRFLPEFAEDFPEISRGPIALAGIANRASGQTCEGHPTLIEWSKDRVVLPTVPLPPNWPSDWPAPESGLAPTSSSTIGVSGLTGDGIRGSLHTLATGEQIRPDLVLLDDPQTDESAASPSQNNYRERLVSGAVLGMAGPASRISAVMPCTVIQPDDFIDRILDRQKHPLWRGERTKMLKSMPENMGEWEKYFEVYQRCAQKEPPDFEEANAYFKKRRKKLEKGAEASWPDRMLDTEVSPIQHAMHLWFRSPVAFAAEYQNEPETLQRSDEFATADEIKQKTSGVGRGLVPPWATKLTGFIDVQDRLLYFAVVAWSEQFGGQIVAYGTYPDQQRIYFRYTDAQRTLRRVHPKTGRTGAIYAGLLATVDQLVGHAWPNVDNTATYRIERLMIDAGHEKNIVYEVCRDSRHAAVITPSFGRGIRAGDNPMSEWKRNPGEEIGHQWRRRTAKGEGVRYVLYDTNAWKTRVQHALNTPAGDPGTMVLFNDQPQRHQMIAEHLTAESPQRTEGRGREVIEWRLIEKHRDNHLLDCVVGSAVAASVAGVRATGDSKPQGGRRRRMKLSDRQRGGNKNA